MMSLPARQERVLSRIEHSLHAGDPDHAAGAGICRPPRPWRTQREPLRPSDPPRAQRTRPEPGQDLPAGTAVFGAPTTAERVTGVRFIERQEASVPTYLVTYVGGGMPYDPELRSRDRSVPYLMCGSARNGGGCGGMRRELMRPRQRRVPGRRRGACRRARQPGAGRRRAFRSALLRSRRRP